MKNVAINEELSDQVRQVQLLPGVSRTFALTIPQLPEPLCTLVTNAYLLCRIADTIEDDKDLPAPRKAYFHKQFRAVVAAEASALAFADALSREISTHTSPAERELIQEIPAVIRCLRGFTTEQQNSLQRCIDIMSKGMPNFERRASLKGLENLEQLNQYCYYVAGVVGEMLTELFCQYSPAITVHRNRLSLLAVSFGQGLQMTNILKDFWEDRSRGVCWLPRDMLPDPDQKEAFAIALKRLIVIACNHLRDALEYTLLIPRTETGIRRFALWAIALAVLTLRNIYHHPSFQSGEEVKVRRRTVRATVLICNVAASHDSLISYLFNRLTRELI